MSRVPSSPLTAALFGLLLATTISGAFVLLSAVPPDDAVAESTITVNTATDDYTQYNSLCSLREAIESTNFDSDYGDCPTQAIDEVIRFDLPNPSTIYLTSALPPITDTVAINGALPGGGRIEVRGPNLPSTSGIVIGDVSHEYAAGSSIRNLVLNGFSSVGIVVGDADVTIAGNYIGTNTSGDSAIGNTAGIVVSYTNGTKIGGTTGVTPGGPCTGDCNLISGNMQGISLGDTNVSNIVIEGNFIGTNALGSAAVPNTGMGIFSAARTATIGGGATGAGNLISGNTDYGVAIGDDLLTGYGPTTIRGNRIGTNAGGDSAIPNGGGIFLVEAYGGSQIGGTAEGEGNLISGNSGDGIVIQGGDGVVIRGNRIGTQEDGSSPRPNGGNGILIGKADNYSSETNTLIGGTAPGEANTIAFNGGHGVLNDGHDGFVYVSLYNVIRGNSIHTNGGKGIENESHGNNELPPPVITAAGSASGTACANCAVDVYSDSADEGRVYEGSATADPGGNWSFSGTVSGPNVTATAVDGANNTSEFSAPFSLPATPTPTPTPSPTPSPTPTPTPTPTATPTSTVTPTPTSTGPTPTGPTPTHTATPTATPTPTPTPTGTAGPDLTQGDVDCNSNVTSVDSLKELRFVAQLSVSQTEPCPDIGTDVASLWGDVDCNGAVTSVDALKILRFVAGLSVSQSEPCPDIGTNES